MTKRNRQAIWVVVILVVGLGASLFIPGVRRLFVATTAQVDQQLVNKERTSRSIPRVRDAPDVDAVALQHSKDMAARGDTYHDPKTSDKVCCWTAYGENVGAGDTEHHIHDAFMKSPEHRFNILYRPFNYIGTGAVTKRTVRKDGTSYTTLYVTEIFVQRQRSRSRPAPRASLTPRIKQLPKPTSRPASSRSPTAAPSISPTPSQSVFIPAPIVAPTPTRQVHHRSVLFWVLFGLLVAFLIGMVIFVAFGASGV